MVHQKAVKISDTVIAPKHFAGDSAEAEDWLKYFIRFANYKGLTDGERIQVLSLLLTGVAADWFTTLTRPQTASYGWL